MQTNVLRMGGLGARLCAAVALLLSRLWLVPAVAADACTAAPALTQLCTEVAQQNESREFQCSLPAPDADQRLCVMTWFAGGHDDTMTSLSATLDGKPTVCGPGSRPELVGEDGEFTIHCSLPELSAIGANRTLRATISWRHAQYVGFAMGIAAAE